MPFCSSSSGILRATSCLLGYQAAHEISLGPCLASCLLTSSVLAYVPQSFAHCYCVGVTVHISAFLLFIFLFVCVYPLCLSLPGSLGANSVHTFTALAYLCVSAFESRKHWTVTKCILCCKYFRLPKFPQITDCIKGEAQSIYNFLSCKILRGFGESNAIVDWPCVVVNLAHFNIFLKIIFSCSLLFFPNGTSCPPF